MPQELTADELVEYIKKVKRPVLVRLNKPFEDIPVGTKLYFGFSGYGLVTSNEFVLNLNQQFNYSFDYVWTNSWHTIYTGKFIIVPEYPCYGYEWLKPGDLVDISEEVKNHSEFKYWGTNIQKMAGQKGLKILGFFGGNYKLVTEKADYSFFLPAIYVKLHEPEEPIITKMTIKEIEKKLGVTNLHVID